jgi:hypothetical protein
MGRERDSGGVHAGFEPSVVTVARVSGMYVHVSPQTIVRLPDDLASIVRETDDRKRFIRKARSSANLTIARSSSGDLTIPRREHRHTEGAAHPTNLRRLRRPQSRRPPKPAAASYGEPA